MNRKFKTLGLALVAAFAMSAVVASAASAANFTASSYPASGSGGQTTQHKFTVQGQTVTCNTASFTGSLTEASETITITPAYGNCTAFGFVNAKVEMNGCDYDFNAGNGSTGSVVIKCPTESSITIVASTCTVHIPGQTPGTNTVDYKNEAGGVLVTSTVSGVESTVTSGFLCPLSSKEGDTTGVYTGSTLFQGEGVTVDVG